MVVQSGSCEIFTPLEETGVAGVMADEGEEDEPVVVEVAGKMVGSGVGRE